MANEVHLVSPSPVNEGVSASVGNLVMDDPLEIGVTTIELGPPYDSDVVAASSGDLNPGYVQNISDSFILNVLSELKSRIDMEFASLEDAFTFYNSYVWYSGFNVRKDNTRKIKV
ncbi:hypothetical protein ACLOJK_008710 [Asimina triloba]